MVALINVESSLPRPLWALVRHLAGQPRKRQRLADAEAILSPPSLVPEGDKQRTFERATRTAEEFGLVERAEDVLALSAEAQAVDGEDLEAFYDLLRQRVLTRVSTETLATDPSQTQGKDLLRSLCWFLTLDSQLTRVTVNTFGVEQHKALADDLGNPLRNKERWNGFTYWAPALGFADAPLLQAGGARALVPDCTRAVRRTVREQWRSGTHLRAREFVDGLLEVLPVLPGGRFSRALGLKPGPLDVAAVLSFALQRGREEGWLILSAPSDAIGGVQFSDPRAAGGVGRFTDVEIGADDNG
ncbi:protein DpdG [Micromonospora sp. WMMD1128]|uniref:protein DpdG n=1 Tax=Micromonospora TaxID=1873 RepID=UPI00248BBA65|nr:protein DpdG [Micromonospora sp. WMMD1128]WBB72599.1 protein DpdG [Micromonospora sp. WMMD1128]